MYTVATSILECIIAVGLNFIGYSNFAQIDLVMHTRHTIAGNLFYLTAHRHCRARMIDEVFMGRDCCLRDYTVYRREFLI